MITAKSDSTKNMAKTAIDGNSGVLLLLLVGVGVSEF
jgi:hypothetical protein